MDNMDGPLLLLLQACADLKTRQARARLVLVTSISATPLFSQLGQAVAAQRTAQANHSLQLAGAAPQRSPLNLAHPALHRLRSGLQRDEARRQQGLRLRHQPQEAAHHHQPRGWARLCSCRSVQSHCAESTRQGQTGLGAIAVAFGSASSTHPPQAPSPHNV